LVVPAEIFNLSSEARVLTSAAAFDTISQDRDLGDTEGHLATESIYDAILRVKSLSIVRGKLVCLSGMLFTVVLPAVSSTLGIAVLWDRAVVRLFDAGLTKERAKAPMLSDKGRESLVKTFAAMAFASFQLWQSAHAINDSNNTSNNNSTRKCAFATANDVYTAACPMLF
jgi:hypothetical protein